VPAAARIAERYGTPGAGLGPAQVLRDKHLLRAVAGAAGVGNPASRPVSSAEEVAAFQAEIGGPVIIKPANRQAAIGTLVVTDPEQIPAAWLDCLDCLDQDEESCLPDRKQELRMLVEQFVRGEEYSVEMLYSEGIRVFANVTAKVLCPGPHPVERGHLVPAPIPTDLTELLIGETGRLLAGIGFGVGLVHCEWIVDGGRPYLVECAGRQPGDYIRELIQGAYAFDLFRAYVDMMRGTIPQAPTSAVAGAASWYRTSDPGEVISVDGLPEASALPGVKTCLAQVEVGQTVKPLRSSWDRTAVVTVHADSATAARETAERATELIVIETKAA
jgi:biotin carboxylase